MNLLLNRLNNGAGEQRATITPVERDNFDGRLFHTFCDDLGHKVRIHSPSSYSSILVERIYECVSSFTQDYGWVWDNSSTYSTGIPESKNSYKVNDTILQELVEYIIENDTVSSSRKFAVLISLFNFYEHNYDLFEDFEDSRVFVDDILSKQVDVIDFHGFSNNMNQSWNAVYAYYHPLYSLLGNITHLLDNVDKWASNLMNYVYAFDLFMFSWEEYRRIIAIISNILYGNSDNIDEAVVEYSTKSWDNYSEKEIIPFVYMRNFYDMLSSSTVMCEVMSGDDMRRAYEYVDSDIMLEHIGIYASVFGDDCWRSNTNLCSDHVLWLMMMEVRGLKWADFYADNKIVADFIDFIEKPSGRQWFFRNTGYRNGGLLLDEMKSQVVFLLDMVGEDIFEAYWKEICLSNVEVFSKKVVRLEDLEALSRYKETKDEWNGIPLHLALELV